MDDLNDAASLRELATLEERAAAAGRDEVADEPAKVTIPRGGGRGAVRGVLFGFGVIVLILALIGIFAGDERDDASGDVEMGHGTVMTPEMRQAIEESIRASQLRAAEGPALRRVDMADAGD